MDFAHAKLVPQALQSSGPERSLSIDSPVLNQSHGDPPSSSDAKPQGPVRRRAPIACRRCRRLRSKCIHDKAEPPCKACEEAGLGIKDCIFPTRGQPDNDREYRHPRMRVDKSSKRDANRVRRDVLDAPILRQSSNRTAPSRLRHHDEWDLLPPLPEIIDAVHHFTSKYFQLGFIPKQLFPQQLREDHRSVGVFLLLGILSVSARFSPALVERYNGEIKAVDYFMERASTMALAELYEQPTLERCQAFYLLSLAQQGSGQRNRSYINLGIATRMAVLLHLHREEFYHCDNPSRENVIRLESARRTLWMLHSQDNLHCGAMSPTSLAASDITCLLPSDEDDFANGVEPAARAALEDTPPARDDPSLIHQPSRSLFASLIQAHYYWGIVARRALVSNRSSTPWDDHSDYAVMTAKLADWERQLPAEHRWSMELLTKHKARCEDLAYVNVTMMTKLCNIVLRRPYLDQMINPNLKISGRRAFFSDMANDLFRNVRDLYEQIDLQHAARQSDESVGAQMASFCVYSCGLFATYLCRYKNICSDRAIVKKAPNMLQRCMSMLIESKEFWPLASRWLESLERFSRDPRASVGMDSGMADGNDPALRPILHTFASPTESHSPAVVRSASAHLPVGPTTPGDESTRLGLQTADNSPPSLVQSSSSASAPAPSMLSALPMAATQQTTPIPPAAQSKQHYHQQQQQQQHHHHHHQPHQTKSHQSLMAAFPPQPQQRGVLPQPPTLPSPQGSHHQQQAYPTQASNHAFPPPAPAMQQQQQQQQQAPLAYGSYNSYGMIVNSNFDQPVMNQHFHIQSAHQHEPTPSNQPTLTPTLHVSQPPPHQGYEYQLPQVRNPSHTYDAPPTGFVCTPPTPTTALGPGNDGFEGELQSWFGETPSGMGWASGAAGMGPGGIMM